MPPANRGWLTSVALTIGLLALIALASVELVGYFDMVMPIAIGFAAGAVYLLIPGSGFFALGLTNFLSVYTCLFIVFTEVNFWPLPDWAIYIGYVIPIATFFGAVLYRRSMIQAIVTGHEKGTEVARPYSFRWLAPVSAIGIATFFLPQMALDTAGRVGIFLGAMTAIGIIVFWASRGVAMFLLDASLVFESFSRRVAMLALPVFAFFSVYSLLVIVFAAVYRVVDRFSAANHFLIDGMARDIRFTESLYFSLITLSTVGYGDITPESEVMRVIVAVQVVAGVVLVLFGFYEIMNYARGRGDWRGK